MLVLLHLTIHATREDFRGGLRHYRAATVRKRPLAAFAISGLQLRTNVWRTPRSARVPLDPPLPSSRLREFDLSRLRALTGDRKVSYYPFLAHFERMRLPRLARSQHLNLIHRVIKLRMIRHQHRS